MILWFLKVSYFSKSVCWVLLGTQQRLEKDLAHPIIFCFEAHSQVVSAHHTLQAHSSSFRFAGKGMSCAFLPFRFPKSESIPVRAMSNTCHLFSFSYALLPEHFECQLSLCLLFKLSLQSSSLLVFAFQETSVNSPETHLKHRESQGGQSKTQPWERILSCSLWVATNSWRNWFLYPPVD